VHQPGIFVDDARHATPDDHSVAAERSISGSIPTPRFLRSIERGDDLALLA
jgi:hypothetical protein